MDPMKIKPNADNDLKFMGGLCDPRKLPSEKPITEEAEPKTSDKLEYFTE